MSEWQSIETAPENEPVLVWGKGDYSTAERQGTRWLVMSMGTTIWEGADDTGGRADLPGEPTHWMPLPKAPAR